MYSKKTIEHFSNPHNSGEIVNPDGTGEAGNTDCGDMTRIMIKVEDDCIEDIKFQTFGCAAAIATSSVITDMAMGKTIEAAYQITRQDVADELGGLPAQKMNCSNLASDGLKAAINDYLKKNGRPPLGTESEGMDKYEIYDEESNNE